MGIKIPPLRLHPSGSGAAPDPQTPPGSGQTGFLYQDQYPIHAEIYSLERLEEHARSLASSQEITMTAPRPAQSLLVRLNNNGKALEAGYQVFAEAANQNQPLSPAAEWLLDNYYIVQEQLREIRKDMPRHYYMELPKLATGELAGLPRVYAIALELIAHTDARLDTITITRFVEAYQQVKPLLMGELWAVAIMLRLGLIENLRRLVDLMRIDYEARREAFEWSERAVDVASKQPSQLPVVIAELARDHTELSPPFIAEAVRHLSNQNTSVAPVLQWFSQWLQDHGTSEDEQIALSHQRQATVQVSIANSITSMRQFNVIDWPGFVEQVSVVNQILKNDPAQVYSKMDFATRDRYRHVVEKIARRSPVAEWDVARAALRLASQADPLNTRGSHAGYYLIDRGRPELERQIGYREPLHEHLYRFIIRNATFVYLGAVTLLTLLLVVLAMLYVSASTTSAALAGIAGLLSIIPASVIAISLVNFTITSLMKPRVLPKLELKQGIPEQFRTMVVVPVLLSNESTVQNLLERLEVNYLSNQDPNLHFALLSDCPDCSEQFRPEDEELVNQAIRGIHEMNERYGKDRFFLFHRIRRWNPREGCWMGWERKRGKLMQFNALLHGECDTDYTVQAGDLSLLPQITFVLTLDADTGIPHDEARRMIGTLAHPLNRARIDPGTRRVAEGYSLLQPRVSVRPISANTSLFSLVFSGMVGIDPYTTAVSDVYQDLFCEGIFTGKGLYDVRAFEAALENRFPENALLSHDLIEGSFARVALATDTELYDDYPASYLSFIMRQHRWVRGDWQLLPWLLPLVPSATGRWVRNTLPVIARWKILDNLRRSLTPAALVAMLVAGWTFLPGSALFWTVFALLALALPAYTHFVMVPFRKPRDISWGAYLNSVGSDLTDNTKQTLLNLTTLAHQAWVNLDAIVRVLGRMFITRRRLLEWVTAAEAERMLDKDLRGFLYRMWPSIAITVVAALLVGIFAPLHLIVAAPFLALWLFAPAIMYRVSQPRLPDLVPITEPQRLMLRRLSRRTWGFFETFVGPESHWLPPDNFQEVPAARLAERTSPTNIGLLLLSTLSAYDLGYLSLADLIDRIERTFATLEQLQRYQGHFYNWYNTRSLDILHPAYVSTVDSGNMATALIALRQGLLELRNAQLFGPEMIEGLNDTLLLLNEALVQLTTEEPLLALLQEIGQQISVVPAGLPERQALIRDLTSYVPRLHDRIQTHERQSSVSIWGRRLINQIESFARQLQSLEVPPDLETPALAHLAETNLIAQHLVERCEALARHAEALAFEMDYTFLYDQYRELFAIGYNVTENRRDTSYYDLLASEARLASFFAIAKRDVPQSHWFKLGRSFTTVDHTRALLSWSGTMFEYLMPPLLMRNYEHTMLDQTYHAVIHRQMQYCHRKDAPWGISESGFYAFDYELNYQYKAFGVPGLGLKRGLSEDLVIAPYASLLALPLTPSVVLSNMLELNNAGAMGRYGYYEALDYTPTRLKPDERRRVVREYMAHHQGMIMVALDNYLTMNRMQDRFHSHPLVEANELLLQERIPRLAPTVNPHTSEVRLENIQRESPRPVARTYTTPNTPLPFTNVLSNRNYSTMVTNGGGGFSSSGDLAVTRWQEDPTSDNWGTFFYIRDTQSGTTWSATYQPLCRPAEAYQVIFSIDKAEFRRRDGDIETVTEVAVSPDDNAEVRRLTFTNHGTQPHTLEVTSYAEVVLAPRNADLAHPAFSKLFIETEYLPEREALLCRRRPRSSDQKPVWAVHVVSTGAETDGNLEYETDRTRFLGRGNTVANPIVIIEPQPLSNTVGIVLDPIVSLRRRVTVEPGKKVEITFTTAFASSEEEAQRYADMYRDPNAIERAFELAWTHAQVELRYLEITAEDAHNFQRLANYAFYNNAQLRPPEELLARNSKGQSGLWAYGISGDYPIILVRIKIPEQIDLVREILKAYSYWRQKSLMIDVVILNEHPASYVQELQDQITSLINNSPVRVAMDKPGGIFVRRGDLIPEADKVLLQTVARAILYGERGTIAAQLNRQPRISYAELPGVLRPARPLARTVESGELPALQVEGYNGIGGFTHDAKEYILQLKAGQWTPAPWSNIAANPKFGFLVTDSGAGYTWSENSRENKLTPWSNDPVSDTPGEAIYIRDEETGEFWTPTALPVRGPGTYQTRHGIGYSIFTYNRSGIESELTLFVPRNDSVKIMRVILRNRSGRARQLSLTAYQEWVLGVTHYQSAPYIITERDEPTGAVLAYNHYNSDFGQRLAFAFANRDHTVTGDRTEFLGRNRTAADPAAMYRTDLSNRVGAGFDPCAALRTKLTLEPGEEQTVIFLLGQSDNRDDIQRMINQYRDPNAVQQAFNEMADWWSEFVGLLHVQTPDPAINQMLNVWLLYQALSCRIWGRSAFYQSGGAFGFRDQLQDSMAMVFAAPYLTREQILLHASRQFLEGDVQHWWHPPSGRGIRTRCSDDYLWLPFVTAYYMEKTQDTGILDEVVSFIEGRPLEPGEDEYYDLPRVSEQKATLYEHCLRALNHGLRYGPHGLPLIGSCDWNDGMNRVGNEGRGESIWLGWFLYGTLQEWIEICKQRGDETVAEKYRKEGENILAALEGPGWDGEWYRRAYYDDGTPLGSKQDEECKIDSIAQSWGVITGAAQPERRNMAMQSVEKYLVREQDDLIMLFTPPFDKTPKDPGYIKGYVPGVRENGGQYTHAALWTVLAFAMMGKGNYATRLYDMINPVNHTRTPEELDRYKVEPYVVVADVYSVPPHVGRGGWTWYTGSAGWMYRIGIEAVLGFQLHGTSFKLDPHIPADWPRFEMWYRRYSTTYHIVVENPDKAESGVASLTHDGQSVDEVPIVDDSRMHEVVVRLGKGNAPGEKATPAAGNGSGD